MCGSLRDGTQRVEAKCVPRMGSSRVFDVTLFITCSHLFASSLTKQSVNVSECHSRHQCKPLITMAFGYATAPAGIAGDPVRPYVRGACYHGGVAPALAQGVAAAD